MPNKEKYWKTKKPCPNCGNLIASTSKQCVQCNRKELRQYPHDENISSKAYQYIRDNGQRQKLRKRVFDKLGHKCVICGFDDKRALHIDHKNNDGYNDRKLVPCSMKRFKAVLADTSNKYQILCANCNFIKKHNVLIEKVEKKYGIKKNKDCFTGIASTSGVESI